MTLSTGTLLHDRYRIVKMLGQGGFGAVYRAWDLHLNTPCALKENLDASPEAIRQFTREAQLLANLRHPGLPKVTDHFSLPGQGQYLVMEFVEGENLEERRNRSGGILPEKEVVIWTLQILHALEYLHQQSPAIIHRDIKPANIRITPQGQAMLVDFGIAKIFDPSLKTTVGARAVTPGYSPLEQYGQGITDARTDLYALGATLYTLLTGQIPPESIIRAWKDPLQPLAQLKPQLSTSISNVIEKALKIDPNERWQSAAEMREGLRFSLEEELKPKAETENQQAETLIVAPVHYEPATSPFHPPESPKEWVATTPVPGSGRGATDQPGLSISERKPSKKIRNLVGAFLGLLVLACGCAGGYMLYLGYLMNEDNSSQATKIILATSTTLKVISPTAISQDQSIKMGLLAPLTGPVPDFGKSVQQGAQLAVKEWNARGGVLGKKIDLLVVDSQCQADPAVAATNKLINQEGVRYLIGEVCSNASIPVSEIVNQKKVVQISPTSTNVLVTVDNQGNTKPFTFRACFIDSFQGLAIAKFARGMGYETAIVIYDPENEYVRGLAEEFQKSFPALGGSIVGSETYSASDTDFSAILEKVAASKAHVLYVPDYYPIINLIASQIKDRGIRVALMGGDGWDSKELDIEMIDAGYYSNHYDSDDTRANVQEWIKRYGLEYKDENANPKVPDAAATLAYDATNLLLEAIQKTGLDDTNLVVQTLEKMRWEGVTGVISFDHQHNPIKPAVVIAIQGGKKVYVKSVEP